MGYLVSFFVFVFGAIIGSFLNVVILRHNTGNKITKDRSRCFSCGKTLRWYELIPILSFVLQKGKCRECKSRISWQYPLVEALTGLVFLLIFNNLYMAFIDQNISFLYFFGYYWLAAGYYFVLFSLLIIISVYDFRHQIIPNEFVYPFVALSFFSFLFDQGADFYFMSYVVSLRFLSGFVLFSFFAILYFASGLKLVGVKKGVLGFDFDRIGYWMGFGDAKLALGIGFMLGLVRGFLALILSFWIGALVSIFLLFLRGKVYNMKSKIAFGPFLVLAATIVFFGGDWIIGMFSFW